MLNAFWWEQLQLLYILSISPQFSFFGSWHFCHLVKNTYQTRKEQTATAGKLRVLVVKFWVVRSHNPVPSFLAPHMYEVTGGIIISCQLTSSWYYEMLQCTWGLDHLWRFSLRAWAGKPYCRITSNQPSQGAGGQLTLSYNAANKFARSGTSMSSLLS